MTDLILAQQEGRLARARRLAAASDRALRLSERAKKRLTLLTFVGGGKAYPTTGESLCGAAYRRSRLAAALHNLAVRTLAGAR